MNEDFLIYLWNFQLFTSSLTTQDGQTVTVAVPGMRNLDSGPDFFNGKIKIGDTLWAGNIEIHVKASDWFIHHHQNDEAYNNIILHVVHENDKTITRKNGEPIPVIEVKKCYNPFLLERYQDFISNMSPISCHRHMKDINHFKLMSWFDSLMIERLNEKTIRFQEKLLNTKTDFGEVFYQKLCRNFGFKTNADAMEQLATSLPWAIVNKHKNDLFQLEALLYGQAGFLSSTFHDSYPKRLTAEYTFLAVKYSLKPMDKKVWKFMRMRPANFPTIRIAQFAGLLYCSPDILNQLLDTEKISHVLSFLKINASPYWNNHYQFDLISEPERIKKLGAASARLITINTIVPFLFIYNQYKNAVDYDKKALDWMEQLPTEKNAIVDAFIQLGIKADNALQSQALLQLKGKYCDLKRCLDCRIGHELLKPENAY